MFKKLFELIGPALGLYGAANLGLKAMNAAAPDPGVSNAHVAGIGLTDNRNTLLAMARTIDVKESDQVPVIWMATVFPQIMAGLSVTRAARLQMIIGYSSDTTTSVEELRKMQRLITAGGDVTETPQTVSRKRVDNVVGRMILCYLYKLTEATKGTANGEATSEVVHAVRLLNTVLVEPQDVVVANVQVAGSGLKAALDSTAVLEVVAQIWLKPEQIKAIKVSVAADDTVAAADKNDTVGKLINQAIADKRRGSNK